MREYPQQSVDAAWAIVAAVRPAVLMLHDQPSDEILAGAKPVAFPPRPRDPVEADQGNKVSLVESHVF